ncbi:hypothetical protein Tco_1516506 [Tanacetum coccineum]
MSTQQDIYAVGFENHPPMLNKDNYVLWSSRLLCYAKSKPNKKIIYNSIMHGPYVRRMIPELVKQMEADDQAIQTILMGLPEDIYVVVDSWIANQNANQNGNGNVVEAWAEGDLDEIEEVNSNYILMANLQQASISVKMGAKRVGTIHSSSQLTHQSKSKGFSKLKGTMVNSRGLLHDGRNKFVISRHSLAHLAKECHVDVKKAQRND